MLNIRAAKRTIRIAEFIASIQVVYPQGKNHKTHCLFHDERTPSMELYEDTQRYHCFGCGVRGDLIDLAKHVWDCDTSESLRRLTAWVHAGRRMPSGMTPKKNIDDVELRVSSAYEKGFAQGRAQGWKAASRSYNLTDEEMIANPTTNGHHCKLCQSVNLNLLSAQWCEEDAQYNSMIDDEQYQLSMLQDHETQDFRFGLTDTTIPPLDNE